MTAALIPVKSLRDSKSRLAAVLSQDQRHELTLAMLGDVLASSIEAGLWPVVVISRDAGVLSAAVAAGARGLIEPEEISDLNAAVGHGLAVLERHGADHALVILPDVPTVTGDDLRLVGNWLEDADVVVVPAEDGGTNVLGLRLPPPITTRFGADSARLHCQAATLAEINLKVEGLPSLRWDLDSPEDLERYLAEGVENRTRAVLLSFGCLAPVA